MVLFLRFWRLHLFCKGNYVLNDGDHFPDILPKNQTLDSKIAFPFHCPLFPSFCQVLLFRLYLDTIIYLVEAWVRAVFFAHEYLWSRFSSTRKSYPCTLLTSNWYKPLPLIPAIISRKIECKMRITSSSKNSSTPSHRNSYERGIRKLPGRWAEIVNNDGEYLTDWLFYSLLRNKYFKNSKNPHELMPQPNT